MQYEVTGKLYTDSVQRRTSLSLGTFDTLAEAVAFVAAEADGFISVEGETLTIEARDRASEKGQGA